MARTSKSKTDLAVRRTATARRPFRLKRRPEERIRLLGQIMDMVKPEEVMYYIINCVDRRAKSIVANHNAHSLYLLRNDKELQAFYDRADLIEVDSLPLLLWARWTGRSSRRFHRCTYLDWRTDFWQLARELNWRVFYLGCAPGVAERAARRIRSEWPDVTLATHDGYFDMSSGSAENDAVLSEIATFQPDVLMVGMGMPRQEIWIQRNYEALPNCVVLPVGGAFDYEAGEQTAAPRWMGQVGLEWMFRLAANPRRLFFRYCVEPWRLLELLIEDIFTARRARREAALRERRSDRAAPPDAPRRRASDRRGEGPAVAPVIQTFLLEEQGGREPR